MYSWTSVLVESDGKGTLPCLDPFGGFVGEELPSGRFGDRGARDRIGKPGSPECAGPDLTDEIGLGPEGLGDMSAAGVGDADALASEFGEADGLREVAVVADDDTDIVPVAPSVVEEMGSEIDVGAFLLGSEDLDGSRAGAGVGEQSTRAACHESAEVQGDRRAGSAEGAKIGVLALGLGSIARFGGDAGGEVT